MEPIRTLADMTAVLEANHIRSYRRQLNDELRALNVKTARGAEAKAAYASEEWRRLRKFVFFRCRGYCEACGRTERNLDVHHMTYHHGILAPLFDLKAICRECHNRLHDGWWGYLQAPGPQLKLPFAPPANDNDAQPEISVSAGD